MTAPLVHTRREAAALLRCGLTKITALLASGELVSVKIGGTRLIRDADLRAYVDSLEPDRTERAA